MRKFWRYEKLGMVAGIIFFSAYGIEYVIFYHFVEAETIDNFTMFIIVISPLVVMIGMMVACGILEHYDKKKAGWKRKNGESLTKEITKGDFIWYNL